MDYLLAFGGFFVCCIIIFFAGRKLSWYGDKIAEITGWGKAWVGLILMASVTSLPELMVGISSSAIVEAPDLAVGDILGSCAFNLLILAAMDAFVPDHKPIFSIASASHILAAALGIILVSMVGFALFLPNEYRLSSWIGISSLLFTTIYLSSMRIIYLFEQKKQDLIGPDPPKTIEHGLSLNQAWKAYVFYAVIIVVTALALPWFAEKISTLTGLKESFVGTVFLAISTSLPEVAVSIASVRMGAIDLAVGNLLGSNLFNIFILAIDDIFYTKGLLLKDASDSHISSVLSVIIMSAIVVIGLTYRIKGKRYFLAWDAALILIVYIVNMIILFNQ